jgi:hypothetical protein
MEKELPAGGTTEAVVESARIKLHQIEQSLELEAFALEGIAVMEELP